MERHINKFVLVWALALTALMVMGLTVPNTFTSGTAISSAEMNANFAAINAAVTALENEAGRIRGFALVEDDGTISTSWMANGGTPTLTNHSGTGLYDINFPGEDITTNGTNRCILANVRWTSAGYVAVSGNEPDARIRIFDESGALVDRDFWIMITGAP